MDKYEGDAIIAFWNAPLTQPDHAVRCVRAALRCQAKLAQMRPSFRESLGKDLKMRIGINTGYAVVGNMGSHSRFDYTMIGDAVNLASRLEGINKQFGTYTLISQTTKEEMADAFPAREVSRVAVVGRKEPVVIHEPLLPEDMNEQKQKTLAIFSKALNLYYGEILTRPGRSLQTLPVMIRWHRFMLKNAQNFLPARPKTGRVSGWLLQNRPLGCRLLDC